MGVGTLFLFLSRSGFGKRELLNIAGKKMSEGLKSKGWEIKWAALGNHFELEIKGVSREDFERVASVFSGNFLEEDIGRGKELANSANWFDAVASKVSPDSVSSKMYRVVKKYDEDAKE